MTNTVIDLWPEINVDQINERSPHLILKQQAEILAEKTLGIIEGRVIPLNKDVLLQDDSTDKIKGIDAFEFFYVFTLVAPALGNHVQPLFMMAYPLEFYPCIVGDLFGSVKPKGRISNIENEQELTDVLRETFASERTQRILQALISQSKE